MTTNIWTIITAIFTAISAVGMIFITYFVYKWTSYNSKKETYFRHMVDLYYKIEKDSIIIAKYDNDKNSTIDAYQFEQCIRSIAVNCCLMIYYLQRIPGYYEDRHDFFGSLYYTSRHPLDLNNYTIIAENFKHFCWEIRDKKKKGYTFSTNYDGSPIKD